MSIPTELAGRRVLATATVEPGSKGRHPRVRGVESENPQIRFLAIVVTDDDFLGYEEIYLFHCDEDWNVIWDSCESAVWSAVRQARWEYGDYVFFPGLDESPPAGWS